MPGSSVLPVAYHKGKLYFLFGKENPMEDSAHGFSDFGGGIDAKENPFEAAMREGSEELTGFLGSPEDIRRHIKRNGGIYKIVNADPLDHDKIYTIHLLYLEYDDKLPVYYNNNHQFLWNRMDKKLLNSTKLFEKIKIDWFCETDLRRRIKEYRPFYRKMVERIISELPQIRAFIRKCAKKSKTRRQSTRRNTTRKYRGGDDAPLPNNTNNIFAEDPNKKISPTEGG